MIKYEQMEKIIGFFSGSPTWREISKKEYKKVFDHDLAILYLKPYARNDFKRIKAIKRA